MNCYANLNTAMMLLGVTIFVMSWDFVPPVILKIKRAFIR